LVGIFKHSSSEKPSVTRLLKPFLICLTVVIFAKTEAQSTASKQVTKFSIEATELATTKQIWVYLPKSYASSRKRYPVLYMHDAQNLFDASTSYAGEWEIDEYLDRIESPESIIVGIEHGNEKRIDELTPFRHKEYGGGNGDNYLKFIKNTLKPYIDKTYRTKPRVEWTGIFGSSLGGLISFYAMLKYPETFGRAGVFSPAFWINPEIYQIATNATLPKSSKFYFLAGRTESETMVTNIERMVDLLKQKGVPTTNTVVDIVENGQHNEQFWGSQFGKAYQWLNKK